MNPFTEPTVASPLSNPQQRWRAARRSPQPAGGRRRNRKAGRSSQTAPVDHAASDSSQPTIGVARRALRGWRCLGRKVCFAGAALLLPGVALALNVNAATQEQLQAVRGIGPKTAQIIVHERNRGGSFESFDDLSERVKGIGPKKAASLKAAGLTVEGGPSFSAGSGAVGSPGRSGNASAAIPALAKGKPGRSR